MNSRQSRWGQSDQVGSLPLVFGVAISFDWWGCSQKIYKCGYKWLCARTKHILGVWYKVMCQSSDNSICNLCLVFLSPYAIFDYLFVYRPDMSFYLNLLCSFHIRILYINVYMDLRRHSYYIPTDLYGRLKWSLGYIKHYAWLGPGLSVSEIVQWTKWGYILMRITF